MKQETLEEYIERETKGLIEPNLKAAAKAFLSYGAKWQQERSQKIVPFDAYNIEVFAIKPDEDGKLFAYIGYKITNGNFEFSVVPFSEPQYNKMYSEEEVINFAKWCAELKVYDNETYVNNTFETLFETFKNK